MGNFFVSARAGSMDDPKRSEPHFIRELLNIRVVLISDTHGDHRSMTIPDGDILIHAGDFTCYGRREQAIDFNDWLGTLPHQYKIVINGNHESNATWKREASSILSNAIFLCQQSLELCINGCRINIFGTDFFWPTANCGHPFLDQIPNDCDILVCHGPPLGLADGGKGCKYLLKKCISLVAGAGKTEAIGRLRLVVCGHIHYGYGIDTSLNGLTVVNASNCGSERKVENDPIVLDI